ncbi:zinc-finger domain-containing protein [Altericroceibacterium xinjiangense]|uniref:zinc-finger domain-containing protein n=1 Tax=Altericroceibacterium xinjiangense TaxID=762261 RepID=UPI000F7D838A|nr:zinc-finger domain-containing protein [Altericroceibacterium xinjiangense]
MIPPSATVLVDQRRISCDGSADIRSGDRFVAAVLGHPRVWLQIDEHGYVDCGYCDRRFVLKGGPADGVDPALLPDIPSMANPES